MKTPCLFKYWSYCRLIAVGLISLASITGCGGTDTTAGVGSGGTGTIVVAGLVADGYLVNASVFLDKNGNYLLDAGEPSTTTDVNGAYKLNLDPADVGAYPIVALVIKGVTIDKDTNQAVANSYILSMPKNSVSGAVSNNFISPLTSQVRELMETGIYASTQQAKDALRTRMGLVVGTDVMSDYIAAGNTSMHAGSQNIATLLGNQMGLVFVTSGSTAIVDVNRYRGMMGVIFSNMSTPMGTSTQTSMTTLNNNITTLMSNMTPMNPGQPYRNMSTSFRRTMPGMNTN